MRALGSVLFLLLRLLCYAALVVVVLGFGSVIVLSLTGACSRIDTGDIVCSSDIYKQLGEFGMGVMLVTVFTGLPALLALAGVFFLIRKVYLWRNPATHPLAAPPPATSTPDMPSPAAAPSAQSASPPPTPAKSGFGMWFLKGAGVVLGALFLFGLIAGIVEGIGK
jgi:hypothetical protein